MKKKGKRFQIFLAYDMIITPRRDAVHANIADGKNSCYHSRHSGKQKRIIHVKCLQDLPHQRKGDHTVNECCPERQEKQDQDLALYGAFDLPLIHTDLLHDFVAAAVLVALDNLLIVNDQHGRHQEQ